MTADPGFRLFGIIRKQPRKAIANVAVDTHDQGEARVRFRHPFLERDGQLEIVRTPPFRTNEGYLRFAALGWQQIEAKAPFSSHANIKDLENAS